MNISDHVAKLRKYLEFRKYSQITVENYCSVFSLFLKYFDKKGVTHPDKINSNMIIEFLSQFKEPSTHSGYHSAIKIYYLKVAHIGIEKFKYIERPKRSHKLPIVLSVEEIQKMFDVCSNMKHRVIFALLYSCGIRSGELINLKWEHIDENRGIINIIQAKGKKDRQVNLTPEIIPLLEKYKNEYHPKEYVLNGQVEIQYSKSSVLQVIKDLSKRAGLNKRTYTHLIRHCCFTHMAENGIDINKIKEIAGHIDSKTTSLYLHLSHNYISSVQSPLSQIRL